MPDNDKEDLDDDKRKLSSAFCKSKAKAYHLLRAHVHRRGESVEAYVTDIRRLLVLSGHVKVADGKDPMVCEQFLSGVPAEFRWQIQMSCAGSQMTVTKCVEQVQSHIANSSPTKCVAAPGPASSGGGQRSYQSNKSTMCSLVD